MICQDIFKIIDISLSKLYKRVETLGYKIQLTDKAKDFVAEKGYDPKYGARPLKRTIQRRVLDPLALDVLNGHIRDGDHVVVEVEDGKLVFLQEEHNSKTDGHKKKEKVVA